MRKTDVQVTLVQKAVGRETASAALTYYPRMPGNSTIYPEEKVFLQADSMPAANFEGAETHLTDMATLQDLLEGFEHVDLLKASTSLVIVCNPGKSNTLSCSTCSGGLHIIFLSLMSCRPS